MAEPLIAFWINARGAVQARGYGVTAFSEEDACRLIASQGLPLPEDRNLLDITHNIQREALDAKHILPNCGPMMIRGVWYPLTKVGV